ncbi:insulinase family protein, partial [Escherichia coli]|nr:insulinase family protein [Escherichia coli]
LDFVQDPYFTPETVNKEKGIIGQEIQMYDDDPNWRLMFGLLENIYPDHPVSIDIAGTVESIDKITSDQLYENYHTFYHPSNMTLVVVGQFDPEDLMALIEDNQNAKTFAPAEVIKRHKPDADLSHFKKEAQVKMDVS